MTRNPRNEFSSDTKRHEPARESSDCCFNCGSAVGFADLRCCCPQSPFVGKFVNWQDWCKHFTPPAGI